MNEWTIYAVRVKRLLEKRGMSYRELADIIGITEVSMCRYLSGRRIPGIVVILNTAKALNTSIDYLVGIDDHNMTEPCEDAVSRYEVLRLIDYSTHDLNDSVENRIMQGEIKGLPPVSPSVDVVPWSFLERYAEHFCAVVSMPEFIREAKMFYADTCGARKKDDREKD